MKIRVKLNEELNFFILKELTFKHENKSYKD